MWRLVLAIVCVSTGAPFARWAAPAPPLAIAALRVGIASLLLFGAGWREVGKLRALPARDLRLVLASGALLAIHFGSWIASLSFTSTAASVALVATNPMFAALFGTLLGDRVTRREIAGIAIAACGCAVLAGGDWQAGGDALIGDGLALVGAASAAGYLVVGRRLRATVPLFPYLGAVNGDRGRRARDRGARDRRRAWSRLTESRVSSRVRAPRWSRRSSATACSTRRYV